LKFRIESQLLMVSKVTSSKYLLNKFNCFYDTALLWLQIRLRLESLDTDDADDSMFVDFVGC